MTKYKKQDILEGTNATVNEQAYKSQDNKQI